MVESILTSRVRRRPDLAFRAQDEQAWVLATRAATLHRLNETAAWLWARLDAEPTVEALGAALQAHFDVDAPRAAEDVEAFVRALTALGLVDLVPASAAGVESIHG